ncbi:hypothetical protein B0H11DRAFT_2388439 [Mycena galericulata]|nr:hypothetical protein B0H11DRAFT_2388439 [Mycena galericulata]
MGKKRGYVLTRLGNFAKGVVEKLSPRKKRKTDEKENNASDVFLASDSMPRRHPLTYTGFFYAQAPSGPPVSAPDQTFHVFSLPPPPPRRRATVEEVPDEDDISILAGRAGPLDSDDEDDAADELQAEMARATSPRQSRPDEVPPCPGASTSTSALDSALDSEKPLPDGKLREAPSISIASAALKDLPAVSLGKGVYWSRQVRVLARGFIADRTVLPLNPYGYWTTSMLVDEELNSDITLYLQELGKDITAHKLTEFLARPDVMQKHGISKKISVRTAERYLQELGYRQCFCDSWMHPKKGQYADGHERPDVIAYRKDRFLPAWRKIRVRMDAWSKDNLPFFGPDVEGRRIVVWFHDESIFYAHDRRRKTWYHKDAPAKPYSKGEGASLMIADFVSSKYGWLRSPDGTRSARVVMFPGKNKDGYFTNAEIRDQVYSSSGAYCKQKIRMADTDGKPQELYFPDGHAQAGHFKGLLVLLEERGIDTAGGERGNPAPLSLSIHSVRFWSAGMEDLDNYVIPHVTGPTLPASHIGEGDASQQVMGYIQACKISCQQPQNPFFAAASILYFGLCYVWVSIMLGYRGSIELVGLQNGLPVASKSIFFAVANLDGHVTLCHGLRKGVGGICLTPTLPYVEIPISEGEKSVIPRASIWPETAPNYPGFRSQRWSDLIGRATDSVDPGNGGVAALGMTDFSGYTFSRDPYLIGTRN